MSSDYSKELPKTDSTLQPLDNTQTIEPSITTTYRGRNISVGENPSNIEQNKPVEAWREAIAYRPPASTSSSDAEASQFTYSASATPKNNPSTRKKISNFFNKFSRSITTSVRNSITNRSFQTTSIEPSKPRESDTSISSNLKPTYTDDEDRSHISKGIEYISAGVYELGVQTLYKTTQGYAALEKAAQSGFITESINFFKDIEAYNELVQNALILSKNGVDVSDIKNAIKIKYQQIMDTYIKQDSTTPINMDGNLRIQLEQFAQKLEEPNYNFDLNEMQNQFDPARGPLERDLGASFQNSQAFNALKESYPIINTQNAVELTPLEILAESKASLAKANADLTKAEETLNKTKKAIFKNKNSIAKAQANVTNAQTAVDHAEKKVILAALEARPMDMKAILHTKIGRKEVEAFFTQSQSMENLHCLDKLQACNALIQSGGKHEDIINAYNDIIVSHIWKESDMQVNISDFQRDAAILNLSLDDGTIDMAGIQISLNNFEQHLINGMKEPYVQDPTGSIALKNKYKTNI